MPCCPTSQKSYISIVFLDFKSCFPQCCPVTRPPRLPYPFHSFSSIEINFLPILHLLTLRSLEGYNYWFFTCLVNTTFCSLKMSQRREPKLKEFGDVLLWGENVKGGEWAKSHESNRFRCPVSAFAIITKDKWIHP